MQSRYYDPQIGRFINADALATTGQGILGNNMFAYCANNPANYVDPLGHAYSAIKSQFYYNEYEHMYGGLRENFYDLPAANQVDYGFALDTLNAAASYGVAQVYPWYGAFDIGISFWTTYDMCRSEGLSYGDSFGAAIIFCVIPGKTIDIVGDSMVMNSITSVTSNVFLDMYIENNKPSPVEAAQNRSNHLAQKGAFVCVGGNMSFITFGQLEVRDLHVQP